MVPKFDFGWGSAPDPTGGVYSAPQTPSWWGGGGYSPPQEPYPCLVLRPRFSLNVLTYIFTCCTIFNHMCMNVV